MLKILFASRLVEEKWVDILIECIETFSRIDSLNTLIEWHICSDGKEQSKVQEMVRTHTNIIYYGKLSHKNLQNLYNSVDLLLMPSRFLEMFWLVALEALQHWVHVCGIRKWWLTDFIVTELSIDENNPVLSIQKILKNIIDYWFPEYPDIHWYTHDAWKSRIETLLQDKKSIYLIHDYTVPIWGAESHVLWLHEALADLWKQVWLFGYGWSLWIYKRKLLFLSTIFGWRRSQLLKQELQKCIPDTIWMHSILRYVWIWWVYQVYRYCEKYPQTQVLLSHHDLGYISAFPSRVEHEEDIPKDNSLISFVYRKNIILWILSIWKWFYIKFLTRMFPSSIEHIIFANFMKKHIENHFVWNNIHIIPHTTFHE